VHAAEALAARPGPVGVLGFRGVVGDAVGAWLARAGHDVRVVAEARAVERRAVAVGARADDLDAILAECRVLVGCDTTGPSLAPSRLRPGTILVDTALPGTLEPGPLPPGVVVRPGEALRVPGRVRAGFWGRVWLELAGYGSGRIYACLAEPMAMALTGAASYSHGRRLELADVDAVGAVLRDLGYDP
jgi:predicted amino acid dehydrogenase